MNVTTSSAHGHNNELSQPHLYIENNMVSQESVK